MILQWMICKWAPRPMKESEQREEVTEPTLNAERVEPDCVAGSKAMEMVIHHPAVEGVLNPPGRRSLRGSFI